MSVVIGLDLSLTRAGVAVLHDGRLTFVRSVGHGGKDSDSYAERSRRVVSHPPPTLKVWATGNGRADQGVRGKPMMMAAVKEWFPSAPILNDDHADAVACATVGAFHLGDPVPFKVKDRHAATLEKVAMPTMGVGA